MGPYCKFCGQRCFVHFPKGTPKYILEAYGSSTIVAMCREGQAFEKEKVGYCHADILSEIEQRQELSARGAPDGYTYQLYRQAWAEEFGDAPAGEYGYYEGETYLTVSVTRLTEPEFEAHKAVLDALSANFALALETGDDLMMEALLESGFHHELALLL